MEGEPRFSKIRLFFWPVERGELKKFLPMLLLFFLISFNYNLLHITKDALIVTAPNSGAEVIPYLKFWITLPTAFFLLFLFTRVANRFNKENIFYVIVSSFLVFFILFILVLYPYREALYLDSLADKLQTVLPLGAKGFVALIRYWMYSLFYVLAEAWSTIMLSIMLWGFANDVISVKEARRYYPLFGIGVNFSGVLVGGLGATLTEYMQTLPSVSRITVFLGGKTPWDQTLLLFVCSVILFGIAMIGIYRWLHINIFPERGSMANAASKPKVKMSTRKNIAFVLKSKYMLSIVAIVLAYNLTINLTEVLWKSQLKELFPSPSLYIAYTFKIGLFTGILATFGSYFISGNIIRHLGWKIAAYITPIIIAITGCGFFYFLFLKQYTPSASPVLMIMGMTPLALTVFWGSLQNCFSRACKYTLFDDTKEMAFIPLSQDDKIIGKSAIDGIGSRLGKSGSSALMQILLMFFATAQAAAPFILGVILLILPIWFLSIRILGRDFEKLTAQKPDLPQEEALPAIN